MRHYRSLDDVWLDDVWLTIGSFDGVHRGHQTIIKDLVTEAGAHNAPAVVVTFFPHPSAILRGQNFPYYLTAPDEKAVLLGNLGISHVITHPFNRRVANKTAQEFILDLNEHLTIKHLGVGYDFAMGKNRDGNFKILQQIGKELDFTVKQTPSVEDKGGIISSSRIRFLLGVGQVDSAAGLLGRYYGIKGLVEVGDQRGHRLGFPTANMAVWAEKIIPTAGVYACWAKVRGKVWKAVTNIGVRPTFEANPVPPRAETHLIDFSDDIYGENIRVEFVSRIRDEKRFSSIEALQAQIHNDLEKTEQILSKDHEIQPFQVDF
jgi:riboflavin kinase/FMN adenylyltransferase